MSAGAGISMRIAEHLPDRVIAVGPVCLEVGPRDARSMRWFYSLFKDELNFGYRALYSMREFEALLTEGAFDVLERFVTPSTCVALTRPRI